MEECQCCKVDLEWEGNIPFTNIPHTDIYYCDDCLGKLANDKDSPA